MCDAAQSQIDAPWLHRPIRAVWRCHYCSTLTDGGKEAISISQAIELLRLGQGITLWPTVEKSGRRNGEHRDLAGRHAEAVAGDYVVIARVAQRGVEQGEPAAEEIIERVLQSYVRSVAEERVFCG